MKLKEIADQLSKMAELWPDAECYAGFFLENDFFEIIVDKIKIHYKDNEPCIILQEPSK